MVITHLNASVQSTRSYMYFDKVTGKLRSEDWHAGKQGEYDFFSFNVMEVVRTETPLSAIEKFPQPSIGFL